MTIVGLRIDVDTLQGTCTGVPNLIKLLKKYNINASFFFSVGPDNMGRHLWRLIRPTFLIKMFRTKAASLYGLDILLKGLFWPGPDIGKKCSKAIKDTEKAGHEIGLHAWDHHKWQTHIAKMSQEAVFLQIKKGYNTLSNIISRTPDAFAAPGWRTSTDALLALDKLPFRYTSDCRGHSIFQPVISDRSIGHVQIPTTLPTYDELIGVKCTKETYNDYLIKMIKPGQLNILTIHAEVEGNACLSMFQNFLDKAHNHKLTFQPLGSILCTAYKTERSNIVRSTIKGREGWLSCQKETN